MGCGTLPGLRLLPLSPVAAAAGPLQLWLEEEEGLPMLQMHVAVAPAAALLLL